MRISKYNQTTKPASDDFLVIDGDTHGTRSLPADSFSGKSVKVSAIIRGSDWTGTEPFWENDVTVSGVTATNNVDVLLDDSATIDDVKACQQAQIGKALQTTGKITFLSASEDKPTADIPIICLIRGD